jgi:acyl-CoA synthetase (AMP-forming)/AMP-acid ligase II
MPDNSAILAPTGDLAEWARRFPERPAIIMGSGATLSYAELDRRSDALAQRLYDCGLRFGDHVAILMENRIEYPIAAWATQRSGLVTTPINWHLAAEEAAYVIDNCGARIVIASDTQLALIEQVAALTPNVEHWLIAGDDCGRHEPMETAARGGPRYEALEGLSMCYSSGTSGRPKGIALALTREPFGASTVGERLLTQFMGFNADTVYLSPTPLYHTAPFMWTKVVVRNGGTVIIMEKFDAEACLALIERYRPNLAQFVPTMFIRMLKLPDEVRKKYDVSSLRRAVHAAAPCPVETKQRMIDWWGPVLFEFYAGSEGGWVQIESDEWLQHKGSVGKSPKVHILDDNFREVPANTVGVIYFEPDFKFEYLGDSKKTAETYSPQGWMTLGDMGYLDEQGYLFLSDRKSHMIISGGVNIYPQETENVLITHPAVFDVAVIGVPNEDFGEEVKAVVELEPGVAVSDLLGQQLIEYCRERIAHFKCPRSVDFIEHLPRLPNGKLLKRELRARYWPQPATNQAIQ